MDPARIRAKWDAKYAERGDWLFGDAPNAHVRAAVGRPSFAARTALCLADGDGRNGAWLAAQGLSVTAIDISPVGTERARALDARAGVRVERIVADLGTWQPAAGQRWDAVFLIYLQSDPVTRARVLSLAAEVLAPGGWLVIEVFGNPRLPDGTGPSDPAVRYDAAETLAALPGLEIVEALTGRISLDEGRGHRGTGDILRILARRPVA